MGSGANTHDGEFGEPRRPVRRWPLWETTRFRVAMHEFYCIPFHREMRKAVQDNTAITLALSGKLDELKPRLELVIDKVAPLDAIAPDLGMVVIQRNARRARWLRLTVIVVKIAAWIAGSLIFLGTLHESWPILYGTWTRMTG